MSKLDDQRMRSIIIDLQNKLSKEVVAAIKGHILNGASDEEIYSVTIVGNIQDIILIREAIKRNLL